MRVLMASLAAFVWACAAWATELAAPFEPMGTMTAEIGGVQYDMVIPWDTERDLGYAERKIIAGSFLTINTAGVVVAEDGTPGSPLLQITMQEHGSTMKLLSMELFDEQGFDAPLALGADGGKGTLTAYKLEGDMMTASVEGTFLRLTGYRTGEPKPAEGAEPVPVSVTWQVRLPEIE